MARRTGLTTVAVAAAVALGLGGCASTGPDDHARRGAESLVRQAAANAVALHDARCTPPPSTKPGTAFDCTAVDDDGTVFHYLLTIPADGEYPVEPQG